MSGLGGKDGAGDGHVALIGDVSCSTKIGGSSDVLDDGSESDERFGVGVREFVGTRGNRVIPENGREDFDVGSLVTGNLLNSASDPVGEAGVGEGLGVVLGKSLVVERVFEVLESD